MELMSKMHLEGVLKEFEKLKHKMLLKVQQGFERLLAVPEAGRSKIGGRLTTDIVFWKSGSLILEK